MIISLSSLPGDLLTDEALVDSCTLNNESQIQTCSLLDTEAIGIAFIDKKIARPVCKVLQIFFNSFAKPKPLKRFDGRPAWPIPHVIYFTLTVQGHSKLLAPVTDLISDL